ncbi:MAG: hypothetical protein AAB588_00465 [Patescibacteria group bacterium]
MRKTPGPQRGKRGPKECAASKLAQKNEAPKKSGGVSQIRYLVGAGVVAVLAGIGSAVYFNNPPQPQGRYPTASARPSGTGSAPLPPGVKEAPPEIEYNELMQKIKEYLDANKRDFPTFDEEEIPLTPQNSESILKTTFTDLEEQFVDGVSHIANFKEHVLSLLPDYKNMPDATVDFYILYKQIYDMLRAEASQLQTIFPPDSPDGKNDGSLNQRIFQQYILRMLNRWLFPQSYTLLKGQSENSDTMPYIFKKIKTATAQKSHYKGKTIMIPQLVLEDEKGLQRKEGGANFDFDAGFIFVTDQCRATSVINEIQQKNLDFPFIIEMTNQLKAALPGYRQDPVRAGIVKHEITHGITHRFWEREMLSERVDKRFSLSQLFTPQEISFFRFDNNPDPTAELLTSRPLSEVKAVGRDMDHSARVNKLVALHSAAILCGHFNELPGYVLADAVLARVLHAAYPTKPFQLKSAFEAFAKRATAEELQRLGELMSTLALNGYDKIMIHLTTQ